VLRDCPDN
jgi:ketosteroid isomerase-like protein